MKQVLINHTSSKAVGFIHFSCFCGLDIYCFGNSSEGVPPLKAIDKLRGLLDGQPAALFTANDRPSTACPHCGIELELPSAEVLAGFARRTQSIIYDQPEAN
jgi:hypothetical protein